MCFLFNVRMNHYSLPTFESFELVERLYRRTRKKTLISLSCCQNVWCKNLHMCVASRPIQWQQPKRLMDVLELLHTHSLTYSYWCWHHHHICHAILFWLFRDTEGLWMCVFFTPFCLYSWKGLKNTKHLMVIKVARKCIRLLAFRSLFLSLSFNVFPFLFFSNRRKKKSKKSNIETKPTESRWSECLHYETLNIWETHALQMRSIEIYRTNSLVHSSFINRIILIRYRSSIRACGVSYMHLQSRYFVLYSVFPFHNAQHMNALFPISEIMIFRLKSATRKKRVTVDIRLVEKSANRKVTLKATTVWLWLALGCRREKSECFKGS